MNVVLLAVRLVLAVVFGVAGLAKLATPSKSRKAMSDFGVPAALSGLFGTLLPVAELLCAVALIPVASAWFGAIGILVLLVLFNAAICVNLLRGRRPDCQCFGQVNSSPIGWHTVLRNTILAAGAGLVVWQGVESPGASLVGWSADLSRVELALLGVAVAAAVLAAFQMWFLVHVLRQNGRLLLRIEALEKGAPAEDPAPGLPQGSRAPGFSLPDLRGTMVSFETFREPGKPVMLLFTEPACHACDTLLPDVSHWQRELGDKIAILPVSRGSVDNNAAKVQKHGIENTLLQTDREVGSAYLVESTPAAVLVTDGRIASELVVGPDAIRGLVARALLPAPVAKGDAVPSLTLPDLDGNEIDLAQRKGRRTLIIFWNPSCGFCQQMLDDVKALEQNPPKNGPELLIISAGSRQDIVKQGFRSALLLDPNFAASHVFNSGGTPSAVLIDEQGRVASDVGVGSQDVLAMAR